MLWFAPAPAPEQGKQQTLGVLSVLPGRISAWLEAVKVLSLQPVVTVGCALRGILELPNALQDTSPPPAQLPGQAQHCSPSLLVLFAGELLLVP